MCEDTIHYDLISLLLSYQRHGLILLALLALVGQLLVLN